MLADAATVLGGKIYVFGGQWDRMFANSFPTTHPSLAVVLVIEVDYNEALEDHGFLVYLERDGETIGPRIEGSLNVGHPPTTKRGASAFVPLALTFNMVKFEDPGRYEFVVELDGNPVERIPLELTTQRHIQS